MDHPLGTAQNVNVKSVVSRGDAYLHPQMSQVQRWVTVSMVTDPYGGLVFQSSANQNQGPVDSSSPTTSQGAGSIGIFPPHEMAFLT